VNSTHPNRSPRSSASSLFVTTRWTVVLAAGHGAPGQEDRALEDLCQTYHFPLYAYVRRQGYSKEDAEDLVQSFFLRLLTRNYLQSVASEKGKFRAFLLACIKHFLANEWDRARTAKRGGGVQPLSLDWREADTRYQLAPADHLSPDKHFDRAWAITLLERVLARLHDECVIQAKTALFDVLKPLLTADKGALSYGDAAGALGMSEGAVRVAAHRLRRRYRELLREEVAQTLSAPDQLDEEMRALRQAFMD
jgi:RNA polymerase sigma factor (sigma-70 family)